MAEEKEGPASDKLDVQVEEFNKLLKILPGTNDELGTTIIGHTPDGKPIEGVDYRRPIVVSLRFLATCLIELRDDLRAVQAFFGKEEPSKTGALKKEEKQNGGNATSKRGGRRKGSRKSAQKSRNRSK